MGVDARASSAEVAIRKAAARIAAAGESAPRPARDPVNLPMIRNWTEALEDANPVYTDTEFAAQSVHAGLVAPPAMAQVWTMPGLHPALGVGGVAADPLHLMSAVLDEAGFTSVVATNCEQEYHRYLRHGEQVTVRSTLESVTGPKRTAVGEGWFVTTRSTWYAGTEPVATMLFRILKFRPPAPTAPPESPSPVEEVLRPVVSPDTEFFWEGTAVGQLRIQRCGACGTLRHPPGPLCPACGAARPEYVVAAGTGEIYSYVVHHHPPVPGKHLPIVIALVQLPEGVRILGELLDVPPDQVRIGQPVRAAFLPIDRDLTLPAWRMNVMDTGIAVHLVTAMPVSITPEKRAQRGQLPALVIDVTPTFVISTAIATRDFQDVHHDRDRAVERGSQDIFLNILTSTGLVQRYTTDWAGPHALVRKIAIRLGVPCYAGDTLTFSGRVVEDVDGEVAAGCQELVIEVVGRCSLGDHVTGTVRVSVPANGAGSGMSMGEGAT